MTRDELRSKLIAGANELLSHTWVVRGEQRRLVQAQLAAYSNDVVVDTILVNLPPAGAQTEGSAEMSEKTKAIDWAALMARLQALATKIPSLLILVSQLVELFGGKQGQQGVACPPIGPDNCCDHEACCLAVLTSALQTAAIAAEHYEQCCCDAETAE